MVKGFADSRRLSPIVVARCIYVRPLIPLSWRNHPGSETTHDICIAKAKASPCLLGWQTGASHGTSTKRHTSMLMMHPLSESRVRSFWQVGMVSGLTQIICLSTGNWWHTTKFRETLGRNVPPFDFLRNELRAIAQFSWKSYNFCET